MKNILLTITLLFVSTLAQAQTWQILDSLGQVFTKQQKFQAADSALFQALQKVEGQHGKDTSYAKVARNLALVRCYVGRYDKAEPLFSEVKNIREKLLGKKHPEYARSCDNLAILYRYQGFFAKAEPLHQEAQAIRETVLGKKNMDYMASCTNLGILYSDQGLYEKAEPFYLEAKNIVGELLGKEDFEYATACNNLAILYGDLRRYDEEEKLYLEAKLICEAKKATQDVFYATLCTNLATLYTRKKRYNEAELLYSDAKKIREDLLGKNSPDYALSCLNLGVFYKTQGFYTKAERLLLEAKDVQENSLGKKHSSFANCCYNLAKLYESEKKYEKAYALYHDVAQIKREQTETLFPSFSEREKQAYWKNTRFYFTALSNFSQRYAIEKSEVVASLYDQILFTKGIIFSSTQKMKNAILNSGDTLLIKQFNQWKKQRETYTKLYQLPLEQQKARNLDLEAMKGKINDLEKELSKKSALFGQNVQTKNYKWQEVKAKLAKNEVVIEIIASDSAYIALFLTAQTNNCPDFYIFKNVRSLEEDHLTYYNNCIQFKITDTISYNAFWKPIADKLHYLNKKGFKKIYFSPDGVFHQLSLNTLKNPQSGKFLLDEANIQLIGSSRDLIEMNKESKDLSQSAANYQACLLGYPIYGYPVDKSSPDFARAAVFSGVQAAVGMSGSVSLLPGTKKEVENVFGLFNQKKLKVNLLLAENATEEALKNLKSPTILHVATHGFFIPEISDKEVKSIQDAMNRNLLKNPFMRSGLLLAGCQKPNPEGEDGILTAEEVMNLTLDNTELVVMSACETGLGDIQAGEGVFGLQRAFQQAGAKSVLMSLWKVDDEATQTLMTEFYMALLKGQSKRQAFKTAQMNLKKRFPEPYYWGAFVMVGE